MSKIHKAKPEIISQPLQPRLPTPAQPRLRWLNLSGSSRSLAITSAAHTHTGPMLVISGSARLAQQLEDEIRFFIGDSDLPVMAFPDWECLPYDAFSPHQDIISQRLLTLSRLPSLTQGIVITTISTLMTRLPPTGYVSGHSFALNQGDQLQIEQFRESLHRAGYRSVSQTMEPGEYAVRGGLIDLFPMGSEQPYRLDLFDEQIESIRAFDPENQRSGASLSNIHLLPAREYPSTETAISGFRQAFRAQFEGDPQKVSVYRDISKGIHPPGMEFYMPLFFSDMATLFDYLPASSLIIEDQTVDSEAQKFEQEIEERYEQLRGDIERPLLPPERIFIKRPALQELMAAYPRIQLMPVLEELTDIVQDLSSGFASAGVVRFETQAPPQLPVNHKAEQPYKPLYEFIDNHAGRILLVAETAGRRESLLELLRERGIRPEPVQTWQDFIQGNQRLGLAVAELEKGLLIHHPELCIICETQLYGERAAQRRRRSRNREPEALIRSLAELQVGDSIVHEDHGVGRYLGLQILDVGDGVTEFLTLEYAGGDKLYVPVVSLHLISRYTGTDPEHTPLHKLGGEAWEKAKRRAQKKAHDAAVELLDVYARRAARPGRAFTLDYSSYTAFTDNFLFEETPDQERAIKEVIKDMIEEKSMDRLICGDVGFGKTEVALRAAFIAVNSGTQVCILVPTTLLAQQHYLNFCDRFADLPVRIELLSRFRTKSEIGKTLQGIKDGKVDIVIGTHRLLQDDVSFNDLGLTIIDEEHRFGVRQKEKLKKIRSEVDILNLSATPIPRTLNMAMSGLRDISIIATAPERRLAIKTFVHEDNTSIIREACLRELRRGGQVYYLYNEVRTMERELRKLQEIIPQADIRMAHGQMPERELEQIMLDFYHQRFNILLCSTIIESGIDIPSANTIIMQRADKFGLAQLHQLRGRVGRSHHRAYAYLLIPSRKTVTRDAQKRLDAITALEDLGAGFSLASHDLEIRGAGELLGENQSGEIDEIGFTLYSELLNRAVKSLKSGKDIDSGTELHSGTEINIHAPALLPDHYLTDVHMRLILYKRIANTGNEEQLKLLREEVIDRFGLLPEETKLLFKVTGLKLHATPLGITRIDAGPKGARIDFESSPNIDPGKLIRLLQDSPGSYRLDGPQRLRVIKEMAQPNDRIEAIANVLEKLV